MCIYIQIYIDYDRCMGEEELYHYAHLSVSLYNYNYKYIYIIYKHTSIQISMQIKSVVQCGGYKGNRVGAPPSELRVKRLEQ